jgi:hypothetical protein
LGQAWLVRNILLSFLKVAWAGERTPGSLRVSFIFSSLNRCSPYFKQSRRFSQLLAVGQRAGRLRRQHRVRAGAGAAGAQRRRHLHPDCVITLDLALFSI